MTPNSPTWGDLRRFLSADRWREIPTGERGGRRSRHIFFEKVLQDGRVLGTHISHADDKTVPPGRFGEILRSQLAVTLEQFWECIRTGSSAVRPVELDPRPLEHPLWVIRVLTDRLHMTADQIADLSADTARSLVEEYHSRARP